MPNRVAASLLIALFLTWSPPTSAQNVDPDKVWLTFLALQRHFNGLSGSEREGFLALVEPGYRTDLRTLLQSDRNEIQKYRHKSLPQFIAWKLPHLKENRLYNFGSRLRLLHRGAGLPKV